MQTVVVHFCSSRPANEIPLEGGGAKRMCGIAGAYFPARGDGAAAVHVMCQRMRKRGLDAKGEWQDTQSGIFLGHRRLSIIDLDARANQPMVSHDGRLVIVFNGEIYNYRELRAGLEAQGVRFRTTSDTEVILELFRRDGAGALPQLRGMFAIAIWDTQQRSLMVARDPYGIKPLYVARTARGTLFASQVKALLATGLVSKAREPAGIAGFYIWGSVPEPFTTYQDIMPVPAGSWLSITEKGASVPVTYANVEAAWERPQPISDLSLHVRQAVMDSVRAHLVADVPVGVLLSGGVDSGAIAAAMMELGQQAEGITIGFSEFAGRERDEVPRAQQIAAHYGMRHSVRRIGRDEFLNDTADILDAMDQPSIDGVNTWFAAKAVAERGYKVVLSGIGGDEVFCGYDTFRTVPELYRFGRLLAMAGPLRHAMKIPFGIAAAALHQPKLAGIPTLAHRFSGAYLLRRALLTPQEVPGVMSSDFAREGLQRLAAAQLSEDEPVSGNFIGSVAAFESTHYLRNQLLRDGDWASMAHSLELRTPLVDWRLLQALAPCAAQFISGDGKRLLARVPERPLPDAVVNHRKTGFGMPFAKWLSDSVPQKSPLPRIMQSRWARRWACIVAEAFSLAV
jgi:asparagine synthase (glutamine-hydrolysing)